MLYVFDSTFSATSIWNIASAFSPEFNLPMYERSVPDHEGLKLALLLLPSQINTASISFAAASPLFSIKARISTFSSPGLMSAGSVVISPMFITTRPFILKEIPNCAVMISVVTVPFFGSK